MYMSYPCSMASHSGCPCTPSHLSKPKARFRFSPSSEDLNVLVKRHIQSVVTSSPSKALATLENDASELIASGMVTLNAKLMGIENEKLVARVVEIWGFFWDQVLTYVEGVSSCSNCRTSSLHSI